MDIQVTDTSEEITTTSEAIQKSGSILLEHEDIQKDYINACISREKDFPTGLVLSNGMCIAMPHGKSALVKKDAISVVRLKNSTADFGRMDDKAKGIQVSLVFNLALTSGNKHLKVLRKLMSVFQNEEFMNQFAKADIEDAQKEFESVMNDNG